MIRDGMKRNFDCVYIIYIDRLARFGTHPILEAFRNIGISIKIMHIKGIRSHEKIIVNDIIVLMTSFAGKIYQARRVKIIRKKILQ